MVINKKKDTVYKLCVNCGWHGGGNGCKHEGYETINIITGQTEYVECSFMREKYCGVEAKYYRFYDFSENGTYYYDVYQGRFGAWRPMPSG